MSGVSGVSGVSGMRCKGRWERQHGIATAESFGLQLRRIDPPSRLHGSGQPGPVPQPVHTPCHIIYPGTHPDQRLQPWPKGRGTAWSGREIVKRDLYRTSVVGVSTAAGAPDSVGVAGLLSVGASADAGSMITMSATNPQNVSQGLRACSDEEIGDKRDEWKAHLSGHTAG